MLFISHYLNLAGLKLPPLSCLSQSDHSILLSLSVTPPFTAMPALQNCVCQYVLYVSTAVCVLTQNGFSQQNVCVCVCLCLDLVCVFLLWSQWKLMTACCLIKQFYIHTHTRMHHNTQHTPENTQSQIPPQIHKHDSHTTFKLASKQTRWFYKQDQWN